MRSLALLVIITAFLFSCDSQRVFERNTDFTSRYWTVNEKPEFEFEVTDTAQEYNLYCNVRNSLEYPYARIFVNWQLMDSTGRVLEKELAQHMLFHEKTGEPFGETGLGDIYDHQIPLRSRYRFSQSGKFKVVLEQYMRQDTLSGVLAVGIRLEKASEPAK